MQRAWLGHRLLPKLLLSVSVVAPLDTSSVGVMCEGSVVFCPWTLFQVAFGRLTTAEETMEWIHDPCPPPDAQRERSRDELGRTMSRLSTRYYIRGMQTCIICAAHVHIIVKWGRACRKIRSMYMTCLGQQSDILMETKHGTSDLKNI